MATLEDGIEVLTGVLAGYKEDGTFASEGIFARVDQRLAKMAEELTKFNSGRQSV